MPKKQAPRNRLSAGRKPIEQARQPRKMTIREANVKGILAATEPIFAQYGYAGASMTMLARACGLAKANLHYYFGSKQELFQAVLEGILTRWLDDAREWIVPDRRPSEALAGYVRAKMRMTRTRPHASRIFAAELLSGAPNIKRYLRGELRSGVRELTQVIENWMDQGLMDRIDINHLLFNIWAMTQTYADFDIQVRAVLDKRTLTNDDFDAATETIVTLVLKGCGVRHRAIMSTNTRRR
jgi:TetR/AcrR family transcriptional regulator